MIGRIDGTVAGLIRDTVVVQVGGVGYRTHVPVTVLSRVTEGDALALWTYLAVRENSQDLYGFETRDELQWFELLLTVSGVGPKSALAIMNAADTATLTSAISNNDASVLTRASGIGRKTAEKVVLELKDKVMVGVKGESVQPGTSSELVDALMALGYSLKEARDAAQAVPKELTTTEERIREALRLAAH